MHKAILECLQAYSLTQTGCIRAQASGILVGVCGHVINGVYYTAAVSHGVCSV